MANPNTNENSGDNTNPTSKQDWRERGWQAIEGGQGTRTPGNVPRDPEMDNRDVEPGREYDTSGEAGIKLRKADHPLLGDDYRDSLKRDTTDPAQGYPQGYSNPAEPRTEANYPDPASRGTERRDDLINTDRNPMMEVPRNPGGTLRILGVVLAVLLFGLIAWAMFFREPTNTPAPRQPGQQSMAVPQQNPAMVQLALMVKRYNNRQRAR